MNKILLKLSHYLNVEMWRISAHQAPKEQFILIRLVRTFYLAIKGFVKDNCPQKASALTFYSILSIVPVAALAFAIAKGFQLEIRLQNLLEEQLKGQEEVVKFISNFATNYLNRTDGGELAGIGLVMLLWSVMQVFSNVEIAFNQIWEVKHARGFLRKFTDFFSLMFVGILAIASSSGTMLFLKNQLGKYGVDSQSFPLMLSLLSYVVMWGMFTLILIIIPNTKVKLSSALFGGIIAGTMFQLLQTGYIHVQSYLTSYNAIYGSFAALPLFMMWMQLSWLIVLLGSELTFAHQNAQTYEYDSDIRNVSYSYRRLMLLLVTERIIKRFNIEKEPYTDDELAMELKLPVRWVKELTFQLVECKILSEVAYCESEDARYQPAFATEKMTLMKVSHQLENHGTCDFHEQELDQLGKLKHLLTDMENKLDSADFNVLLKDL